MNETCTDCGGKADDEIVSGPICKGCLDLRDDDSYLPDPEPLCDTWEEYRGER